MSKEEQWYSEHVRINEFAIRCFRDIGDGDYIAARMACRAGLSSQFFWAAEQAIEKYLKCILMLNRVPALKIGHRIDLALQRINDELPFSVSIRPYEKALFDRIVNLEGDRYLTFSYEFYDHDFIVLDQLIWRLRQYCVPLDLATVFDVPSKTLLLENVARIEQLVKRVEARDATAVRDGHIANGKLEKILAKKAAAYDALVWKNRFYSRAIGRKVSIRQGFTFVNSPLFNSPELAPEVANLMYIPKDVLNAAVNHVANPPPPVKYTKVKVIRRARPKQP